MNDLSTKEILEKVKFDHKVDDKTVVIGKNTSNSESTSKAETQKMLEQTLDTTTDPKQKEVYEKVWRGVKRDM